MKKEILKLFLKWLGFGILIIFGILFYIVWLSAYLNPDYTIIVSVNRCGEADAEFILMPIFLSIGIWSLWYSRSKQIKWRKTK